MLLRPLNNGIQNAFAGQVPSSRSPISITNSICYLSYRLRSVIYSRTSWESAY
jgi:hypothetical protein